VVSRSSEERRRCCNDPSRLAYLLQLLPDNLDSRLDRTLGHPDIDLVRMRTRCLSLAMNAFQGLFQHAIHQVIVSGALAAAHELGEKSAQVGGPARGLQFVEERRLDCGDCAIDHKAGCDLVLESRVGVGRLVIDRDSVRAGHDDGLASSFVMMKV